MATKTIKGNLVLKKDTVFEDSIVVEGSIVGKDNERYDLTVKGDISAHNISAYNISARGSISYYAVCFAYYNIVCHSIKGARNGAKHFVLDGKITIR